MKKYCFGISSVFFKQAQNKYFNLISMVLRSIKCWYSSALFVSAINIFGILSVTTCSNTRDSSLDDRLNELLASMTIEEKIEQMQGGNYAWGDDFNFKTPNNDRLQIPGFIQCNGTRGMSARYSSQNATTFPVAMARAASWDIDLEARVAAVIASEARAWGYNMTFSPCINQLMHPRWGRAQETYGEDSCLLSAFGVAYIKSMQQTPELGENPVLACVKHFAANNIEDTRFFVNAQMDERTLREVYLPAFKNAVQKADVAAVMGAYTQLNGSYCCQNYHLLREILKNEWDFQGFVISDFGAMHSTVDSIVAGLDLEHPYSFFDNPTYVFFENNYYDDIIKYIENGEVDRAPIDDAAKRILRRKLQYNLDYYDLKKGEMPLTDKTMLETPGNIALALETAEKSIVLLKNEGNILPVNRSMVSKIIVIGEYGDTVRTGDLGSSESVSSTGISPYEGIKSAAGEDINVEFQKTVNENTETVSDADCVIVICAYGQREEGEGKPFSIDRRSMSLPDDEVTSIQEAMACNSNVIVVLESGGAIDMKAWADDDPNHENLKAVLMAWYPGMQGGLAIGEILFGDVNPSGKLPQAFPVSENDYPAFNNTSSKVTYNYYHGYRYLDKYAIKPRYPFGFGLSYTTYEYSNLIVEPPIVDDSGFIWVTVDITNAGAMAGDEIVQLYVGFTNTLVSDGIGRPVKELKDFKRVSLAPGETVSVELSLSVEDLAYYDTGTNSWLVEQIEYQLYVGPSSDVEDSNTMIGSFEVKY